MHTLLAELRKVALAVFAVTALSQPVSAQTLPEGCYGCGSCTCCDEGGKAACFIDCGSGGYCDCCGAVDECSGDHCS